MTTTAEFLAMSGVARRAEGFRFDVITADQIGTTDTIGTLDVSDENPPTLGNDTTATIPRTARPVDVNAVAAAGVRELTDLLRVMAIFGNGDEYPVGVLAYGDASRGRHSWGVDLRAALVDQVAVLDDELPFAVGYDVGTDPIAVAITLAEDAGITAIVADASTGPIGAPYTKGAGTRRRQVIDDMLALGGFYRAHFLSTGFLRYRQVPVLSLATPDHVYAEGSGSSEGVVIDGTIFESNSLLSAPNRFEAIESSAGDIDIVGIFDIPDDAPHSFVETGKRRTRTEHFQGLVDQAAADQAAMAMEAQDSGAYEYVGLDTILVPTHDTFDVVRWRSVNYREVSWSITLEAGAHMGHQLRRVYGEGS